MRILFLHEVNYTTKPIFEMHEFPEYLSRKGHEVAFMHFPEGSKVQASNQRKSLKVEEYRRLQKGGKIRLYTPPAFFSARPLGRIMAAARAYWWIRDVVREFSPDVLVTYAVPTYGWQAIILCRQLGVPIAYRAIDVSHQIRKTAFAPLVSVAERFVIKNADLVVANSPAMHERCQRFRPRLSVVCPPIISATHWKVGSRVRRRKQIVFLGSFFRFSGLQEFVSEFAIRSSEDVRLVLAGAGEEFNNIRKIVEELGLSGRVEMPGWINFTDIGFLLRESSVAVNPMRKLPVTEYALPNKVLQYLLAGLPTVSTRLLGLESYFGSDPACSLYFEETPAQVASRALEILEEKPTVGKCEVMSEFEESKALHTFEYALGDLL